MYPQPWNCCVAEDSLGITEFLPTSPESWDYYCVLPLCLCSAGTGTWGFMYAIQIPYSWATSLSLCLVFFLMSAPPSVLQTSQIVWYPVHFLHQVMHAFSSSHVEVAGVLTTEWLRVWINSIFFHLMTLLFPQSWYILTLTNYKKRKKIAKQNMVQYDSGNTKSKWEVVQLLYVHQIWPRRACSRFLVKDQNLVSSTHTGWLTTTYTLVLGDLTPSLESMGPWTHTGYAGRPSPMHMCAHASAVSLSKSVLKKKIPGKSCPWERWHLLLAVSWNV